MTEKNLYVRCDQETYEMAHAIAKKEGRSLNKQLIQMIHQYANLHEIKSEPIAEQPDKYQAITSDNEDYFAGNQGRSIEMGMTKEEFENHDYDESTESGLQKLSEIKKSDSAD
ncbi:MAG: hypothetical protein CML93_00440 [Rhodobiaceae bacterium]|nr:hypothetical protein [Rhodobiaceae bacterium]|tara:strand:- start:8 stop:346 length:339 start_codon:yes stop_codon:yes gene_type:complete